MNADDFYKDFCSSLNHLGVGFYGKEHVEVSIYNNHFCMTVGGKTTMLPLPVRLPVLLEKPND